MAITAGVGPATGSNPGGADATATLNATSSGRSLVAVMSWDSLSIALSSVTVSNESGGNPVAMTLLTTREFAPLGTRVAIAYYPNIVNGGNKSVVATWSTAVGDNEIWVKEYAGGATATWFDAGTDVGATGNSQIAQQSLTADVGNCLVIAAVHGFWNDVNWTPNGGYSPFELKNVSVWGKGVELLDAGAAGTKTPGFDLGNSVEWLITAAAFKPSGAAPPEDPPGVMIMS